MGFSFRRSFKLGPFGRVYLGKKGASLSIGGRGAHMNFGSRGTRVTVGVPGTGLSYSQKIGPAPLSTSGVTHALEKKSGSGCLTMLLGIAALGAVMTCIRESPWGTLVFGIVAVGAWFFVSGKMAIGKRRIEEERVAAQRARLVGLYGEENVPLILAGQPWVGCTAAMVVELLGSPVSVDQRVMRSKIKRTYKYRQAGPDRFGLRVFLEDDVVVGWEEKDAL